MKYVGWRANKINKHNKNTAGYFAVNTAVSIVNYMAVRKQRNEYLQY